MTACRVRASEDRLPPGTRVLGPVRGSVVCAGTYWAIIARDRTGEHETIDRHRLVLDDLRDTLVRCTRCGEWAHIDGCTVCSTLTHREDTRP